jgi:hypothetical protein
LVTVLREGISDMMRSLSGGAQSRLSAACIRGFVQAMSHYTPLSLEALISRMYDFVHFPGTTVRSCTFVHQPAPPTSWMLVAGRL